MITKIEKKRSNHLDLQKAKNKQLSIQFSLDGFSFCITDLDLLQFVAYNSYRFEDKKKDPEVLLKNIKAIFRGESILQEKFEKVVVIHVNNLSTFVPKALFDENNIANYIKFNNKIFDSDYFTYDTIKNHDMLSVYVPYVNVNNFLIDQFGTFDYRHYATVLVEKLLNEYVVSNKLKFFVHIANTHFEIIVTKNKKLILYNTFGYNTKEDFIYYILFVIEQLKLDVEELSLVLLGIIDNESALYKIAYKYIRNVSLLKDKSKINAILEINETIKRENFTLFNS